MSDMTSEEYKRGFIVGMAMNPLMVTTEAKSSGDRQTIFDKIPKLSMSFRSLRILGINDNLQVETEA